MKYLTTFLLLLLLVFSGCTQKPIVRYECKNFENWARPECNPPLCLKNRICTYDLYPKQFWNKIELQIFPIDYKRLRIQDWIIRGNVEGLTLEQYIVSQNLRYAEALKVDDKNLIERLINDADRVGYYLIPSLFMGGVNND